MKRTDISSWRKRDAHAGVEAVGWALSARTLRRCETPHDAGVGAHAAAPSIFLPASQRSGGGGGGVGEVASGGRVGGHRRGGVGGVLGGELSGVLGGVGGAAKNQVDHRDADEANLQGGGDRSVHLNSFASSRTAPPPIR